MHRSEIMRVVLLMLSVAVAAGEETSNSDRNHFDFLMFTQLWPVTSCLEWEDSGKDHVCTIQGPQSQWTIHGIWPTKNHTIGPLDCSTVPFDIKALEPLLADLEIKWVDVHKEPDSYSFWRHEWVKHGTCAAQLSFMNTELKYFQTALELHDKYNIFKLLSNSGIVPNHIYSPKLVIEKISNQLSGCSEGTSCSEISPKVAVNCAHDKDYDLKLFYELIICLDKSFNRIGCEVTKGGLYGSCKDDLMLYPELKGKSSIVFRCIIIALLLILLLLALIYYFFRKRGHDYSAL